MRDWERTWVVGSINKHMWSAVPIRESKHIFLLYNITVEMSHEGQPSICSQGLITSWYSLHLGSVIKSIRRIPVLAPPPPSPTCKEMKPMLLCLPWPCSFLFLFVCRPCSLRPPLPPRSGASRLSSRLYSHRPRHKCWQPGFLTWSYQQCLLCHNFSKWILCGFWSDHVHGLQGT